MKYYLMIPLICIAFSSVGQEDCIELHCDDRSIVEQHIQAINTEIALFGNLGFCNSGAIQQCYFQGQPVYTVLESPFICDLPTRVIDCEGNSLFNFGGFCVPFPCEAYEEEALLEECVTLYSVFDNDNIVCTTDQLACTESICDAFDQIKTNLLDPNLNPNDPFSGCVPTQTLSQCDYRGLSVIVQSPGACLLADEPWTVYDCAADFLFQYGGFCITFDGSPCPGDLESQFISNCQVIFSVQDGDLINCADENIIPTLGQWSLVSLSILFLIFGITAINENHTSILNSKLKNNNFRMKSHSLLCTK